MTRPAITVYTPADNFLGRFSSGLTTEFKNDGLVFDSFSRDWFIPGRCARLADKQACAVKGKKALSDNYVRQLHTMLRLYLRPFFGDMRLIDIRPSDIKRFRIELQNKGLQIKQLILPPTRCIL